MSAPVTTEKTSPIREIIQPFVDLAHAPRALWGINLAYFLEGMVYFGMLTYLAIHFSDVIFANSSQPDVDSHHMVMVLTAGITISMFFLGFLADKWGIRRTLLTAFVFLLIGRVLISLGPALGLEGGMWNGLHLLTLAGIVVVVIGYGMYQPAAYAGVKKFTGPKTAAMGFAMLYALMNLGGYFPSYAWYLRDNLNLGIPGTFWVYTGITAMALVFTFFILTAKVEREAAQRAQKERDEAASETNDDSSADAVAEPAAPAKQLTFSEKTVNYFVNHPLRNPKFSFFIFALIPVQTLFTYNWLILPQYISRAYEGFIGDKYEFFSNLNPLLIFIAVPIVAAATTKNKIYNLMLVGTFIMAAPAFFLAFGTNVYTLLAYLFVMTIGEAIWQPRFLQFAAEIAPEGRTGEYMGVAQLPWFLTKMLVPLYSGHMIQRFCPAEGARDPERMWLYFGIIAMMSSVLLVMARGWAAKDFKAKAD